MTRVLWVSAEAPDRRLGGGNIRQAHLADALAGRAEVHLLLAGHLGDSASRTIFAGVTEVEPIGREVFPQVGKTRRRARVLWHTLAHQGPSDVRENAPNRRALAPHLTDTSGFDVVHVEHFHLGPLLPAQRSNRWSLGLQQLESRRAEHELALAAGRRQRWVVTTERDKARRLETQMVNDFDIVMASSEDDARVLPPGVAVVPNGVDIAEYALTPLPREPRLLLSGTLHWKPNVWGAQWFCREVWPRILAEVPQATLAIVGRGATPDVEALTANPGVSVHSDVPRMKPFLEATRIAVVPLQIGSGTRLKALEAMAAGRPVVGTGIGLEGLGIEPGRHAAVADDPAAMAAAIVSLLGDDEAARRMAGAGRELVERSFSWDLIGQRFADILLTGASTEGRGR
jgi:glycosyltransferase involved in cell wall biosynthesis